MLFRSGRLVYPFHPSFAGAYLPLLSACEALCGTRIQTTGQAVSYTHLQVEAALLLAGKNRIELQKVLEHYKEDEEKYRATCFLIEKDVYKRQNQ